MALTRSHDHPLSQSQGSASIGLVCFSHLKLGAALTASSSHREVKGGTDPKQDQFAEQTEVTSVHCNLIFGEKEPFGLDSLMYSVSLVKISHPVLGKNWDSFR